MAHICAETCPRQQLYLLKTALSSQELLLLCLYSPLLDFCRFFSFLILYTVGRIPQMGDQPAARPLPTQNNTNTE
jgi:hypothetical protein